MVNAYVVPQARALFAALFTQYLIYGFLYCVEGCKYEEFKKEEDERRAAEGGQNQGGMAGHEPVSRESDTKQMSDIQLEQMRRQGGAGGPQGSDVRYEGGSDDENEAPTAGKPAGDARAAGQDGGAVNIEEVVLEDEDPDQAPHEGPGGAGGSFG